MVINGCNISTHMCQNSAELQLLIRLLTMVFFCYFFSVCHTDSASSYLNHLCLLYTLKEGRIILLIPCPDLSVPTFGTTMTFLVLTVPLNLTKKKINLSY